MKDVGIYQIEIIEMRVNDKSSGSSGGSGGSGGSSPHAILIEEKTVSVASATVDFTSLALSDYYKVELHIRKLACTTGSGSLHMRLNDISTANYSNTGQANQTAANVGYIYSAADYADLSHEIITFYEPSKTDERRKWTAEGQGFGASLVHFFAAGIFEGGLAEGSRNAAITKISLYSSSGNISVGSNFKLIGYKYSS